MTDRYDPESKLHELLDDRLSDAERSELEERLRADPELARRLEVYRGLRRALREEPAEPPPGLVARARARFEATGRARRRPRSRVVAWQAVGLVAAGLIVAALVLPERLGRPTSTDRPREAEEEEAQARPGPADARGDSLPGAFGPESPESEPTREIAPSASQDRRAREPGTPAIATPPPTPTARTKPALAEKKRESRGADASERDAAGGVEVAATEPPAEQPPAAPRLEAFGKHAAVGARALLTDAAPTRPLSSEPLPEGVLDAGALIVVASTRDWSNLAETVRMGRPEPDFASERLVLVGPRTGLGDCAGIRIAAPGEIALPLATPGGTPSPGGCAVVLPAGEEPIELVIPTDAQKP